MTLYLDGSGTDPGRAGRRSTLAYTVAGYLAAVERWADFDPRWLAMLERHKIPASKGRPVPVFRMADCLGQVGDFAHLSKYDVANLIEEAAALANGCRELAIGRTAPVADYYEMTNVLRLPRDDGGEERFRLLTLAIATCLHGIVVRHAGKPPPAEKIVVVFENETRLGNVLDRVNSWIEDPRWGWGHVVSHIIPGPKTLPGLQAADMLANRYGVHADKCFRSGRWDKAERWFKLLSEGNTPETWDFGYNLPKDPREHFPLLVEEWRRRRGRKRDD